MDINHMDVAGQVSDFIKSNDVFYTNEDGCYQLHHQIDDLLRPVSIDWAEDVEEELLANQPTEEVSDIIQSNGTSCTNKDGYHQVNHQIDDLLRPVHVDWAENVEEELLANQPAGEVSGLIQPDGICHTNDDGCHQSNESIYELLRPVHIDWTEDFDGAFTSNQTTEEVSGLIGPNGVGCTNEDGCHQPNQEIDELLRPVQFDWADDVEEKESLSNSEGTADSAEDRPLAFVQTEVFLRTDEREIVDKTHEDSQIEPSPMGETPENEQQASNIGHEMPLVISDNRPPSRMAGSYFDNQFGQGEFEVSREFIKRVNQLYYDYEIHHFNWLGSPVYEYSSTPPAISLLYLLSDPKVPKQGDELRLQSILSRATTYIDPVLVSLEDGWEGLNAKGLELVRFATGRTSKFYTPHGQWIYDSNEKDDQTILDDGDVCIYISPNMAAGNGFAELCPIRSRSQWEADSKERIAYVNASSGSQYLSKKYREYVPSPLRQCMVPEDLVPGAEMDEKEAERVVFEDNFEEEKSDKLGDLPLIPASRKRRFTFEENYGNSNKVLKRSEPSCDLRAKAKHAEASMESSDISQIRSMDPFEEGQVSSNLDLDTHRRSPRNGFIPDMESIPEESEASQHEFENPSVVDASPSPSEDFTVEFVPKLASDVPFRSTPLRRGGRYRAVLSHWKPKWKKRVDLRYWRQSVKTSSILRVRASAGPGSSTLTSDVWQPTAPASEGENLSPSPLEVSSNLHYETSPTAPISDGGESHFTQEYLSFPTPVFSSVSSITCGSEEHKKLLRTKRILSKGRSIYHKVKNRLRLSKDEAQSRKRFLMPSALEGYTVVYKAAGPFSYGL